MKRGAGFGLGGAAAMGAYLPWLRPWELHWGATGQEISIAAPGDELVTRPHFNATRAVSVNASPEHIWPWLVQIGRGRAGWYSYDRLDNRGKPSAREIVPAHQHMALGDVVPMTTKAGESFGPSVLALDPPRTMLWGDTEEPHRFTWLWWLRDDGEGRTRLITRVRCRYSARDPLTALVMELADTIMMRRCMLTIAERAEAAAPQSAQRGVGSSIPTARTAAVDLYWIPLGAGGHCVRFNGKVFEAIEAARQHRTRCDLYHAALIVESDGDRYAVEIAPSPNADEASRGVVATGPVGSRYAGWLRVFRYEVRCWRGGSIPDLGYAVGGPSRLTSDPQVARQLLDLLATVPTPVWGRDELDAGEMWNSNSMIAWLIATAGLPTDVLRPPPCGRAPGWDAGLEVARRNRAHTRGRAESAARPERLELVGTRAS